MATVLTAMRAAPPSMSPVLMAMVFAVYRVGVREPKWHALKTRRQSGRARNAELLLVMKFPDKDDPTP
jgi:hypothetical protein